MQVLKDEKIRFKLRRAKSNEYKHPKVRNLDKNLSFFTQLHFLDITRCFPFLFSQKFLSKGKRVAISLSLCKNKLIVCLPKGRNACLYNLSGYIVIQKWSPGRQSTTKTAPSGIVTWHRRNASGATSAWWCARVQSRYAKDE